MSTSNRGQRRLRRWTLVGVAALGLSAAPIARAAAAPSPQACANRNNNTYPKLLECVQLQGVRAHQAALQAIADANTFFEVEFPALAEWGFTAEMAARIKQPLLAVLGALSGPLFSEGHDLL